jgi:Glutamine amidotransferase domain
MFEAEHGAGEIYDYDRLRAEMIEKQKYEFKGRSDCELVLALYVRTDEIRFPPESDIATWREDTSTMELHLSCSISAESSHYVFMTQGDKSLLQ